MDAFYKDLTNEQKDNRANINFDHPKMIDFDLIFETLENLKLGRSAEIPVYDFATDSRKDLTKNVPPASVIIYEGIHVLYKTDILSLVDLTVFIDVNTETRKQRRIDRDISDRGREREDVI